VTQETKPETPAEPIVIVTPKEDLTTVTIETADADGAKAIRQDDQENKITLGETIMKFKADLIGIEKDVNIEAMETELTALAIDVDTKYKVLADENTELKNKVTDYETLQTENEGLKKQVTEMTAAKTEIETVFDGKLPNAEQLKALKAQADKIFADLIEDAIKYACLANMATQEKANEMRENYRKMTAEQVTYWRDEFKKLYDAKPPLPQTPEPKLENDKKTAANEKPNSRYIIN
jgi:hypothetical protein